jgi:beta-glucosidase
VARHLSRIPLLLLLASTVGCDGSSAPEDPGVGGMVSLGGAIFNADGGWSALGGRPSQDGGWSPSSTCFERAMAVAEAMTPAQWFGQMTQVDSDGLTVAEATAAQLGSVLSGGGSDPKSGNSITDWVALITSYLGIAKTFTPHAGLLYGLDSVHGNNNVKDAVIFPHSIGLGASRDLALAEQVGRITALEMLGVGANWAFHPTVAAALDPRWGRTYEAFSNQAELSGQLGAAVIKGLQNGALGNGPSVLACAKHYAGDGATDGGKNAGDVTTLDEATFRQIAIEPYRPAIEAGVGSVMVSYSSYMGVKMTASKKWLTDVLKGELGFQGIVVSRACLGGTRWPPPPTPGWTCSCSPTARPRTAPPTWPTL